MPSLILFDFDDTLALTEAHMVPSFNANLVKMMAARGILMAPEALAVKNVELYHHHGSSMHGWAAELGGDTTLTLQLFEEMAPVIRAAVLPHLAPNPALISRLQALQGAGHTLAILTLGHRHYTLPLLEKLGLTTIFPPEMVFDISAMHGRLKRDESTYHHLLQTSLTGKFKGMYMFEDSILNLLAAHKAGFHTILIKPRTLLPNEVSPAIDHHSADILSGLDYLLALPPR